MAQASATRAKLSLRRKRLDEARHGRLTAKASAITGARGSNLPVGGAEETHGPDSRLPGGEEEKESPKESASLQHTVSSPVRALEGGPDGRVLEPPHSKQSNGGGVSGPTSAESSSTNSILKATNIETAPSGVIQCEGPSPQHLVGGGEEGGEGSERGSDDMDRDFKAPVPLARAQKRKRQEAALSNLDQEQLQLAMALSASLQPQASHDDLSSAGRGKRGRKANKRDIPPPKLLTISAAESRQRLAQRATEMLLEAQVVVDEDASQCCTIPAFPPSTLASRLGEGGGGEGGGGGDKEKPVYSTLWEMTSYGEGEEVGRFYVPALALPLSKKSAKQLPQPSPVHQHNLPTPPTVTSSHPSPPSHPSPSTLTSPHPSPPPLTTSHPSPPTLTSHPSPPPITSSHPSPPTLTSSQPCSPYSSLPQPPHPHLPGVDRLLSDLSSLVGCSLCSDVLINTGDGRGIPAHSAILVCRCPMLAEGLVQSVDKPVQLDFSQFGRDTVVSFLHYLYTGSIPHGHRTGPVTMLAMSLGMRGCGLEPAPGRPATPTSRECKTAESAHPPARNMCAAPTAGLEMNGDVMVTEGDSTQATPTPDKCQMPTVDRPLPPQATPTAAGSTCPPDVHIAQSFPTDTKSHSNATAVHLSPSPSPSLPSPSLPSPSLPSTSSLRPYSPPSKTTSPDIISVPSSPCSGGHHDNSRDCSIELLGSPHSPPPLLERITATNERTHAHSSHNDQSMTRDGTTGIGSKKKSKTRGKTEEDEGTVTVLATPASPTTTRPSHTSHPAHPPNLTPHTSVPVPQPHPAPTPAQQLPLQSDDDITPMPNYHNMATPALKEECSRFGVRALPKRKMIRKLEEIYDYTHPLVDAEGREVPAVPSQEPSLGGRKTAKKLKRKETSELPASSTTTQNSSWEELVSKVREVITMDTELHEAMVLYKPLELSYIQSRLKATSLSLGKDTLMSVLDHLCVTFSVPRQQNKGNQES